MSRYCDDYDNEYPSHWWQIDLARALTSGRGQRILREIEHALRSMPERRLISDQIADVVDWDTNGDSIDTPRVLGVCAVGAYAAFCRMASGVTWEQAVIDLSEEYQYNPDEFDTQRLGQSVGLTRTVAWHLGWLNDELYAHMTPRQRWRAILRWVRSEIKSTDAPAAQARGGR